MLDVSGVFHSSTVQDKPRAAYGPKIRSIGLAVSIEPRLVSDRQTDTHRALELSYTCVEYASRGNKVLLNVLICRQISLRPFTAAVSKLQSTLTTADAVEPQKHHCLRIFANY